MPESIYRTIKIVLLWGSVVVFPLAMIGAAADAYPYASKCLRIVSLILMLLATTPGFLIKSYITRAWSGANYSISFFLALLILNSIFSRPHNGAFEYLFVLLPIMVIVEVSMLALAVVGTKIAVKNSSRFVNICIFLLTVLLLFAFIYTFISPLLMLGLSLF